MKKLFVTLVMALIASPIFAQMTIEEIESLNKTNPKAAKKEATKFFKKNKKNLDAVVDLARMFMKEKDYATAENLAQMALSVNNKDANVHIFLGDYWYTLDDAGQAASEYEQAVNANPQDTTAYIRYANIYKDKFPVQARQMLEKMGQNCPDKPDTRFGLHLIDVTDILKATEFNGYKEADCQHVLPWQPSKRSC